MCLPAQASCPSLLFTHRTLQTNCSLLHPRTTTAVDMPAPQPTLKSSAKNTKPTHEQQFRSFTLRNQKFSCKSTMKPSQLTSNSSPKTLNTNSKSERASESENVISLPSNLTKHTKFSLSFTNGIQKTHLTSTFCHILGNSKLIAKTKKLQLVTLNKLLPLTQRAFWRMNADSVWGELYRRPILIKLHASLRM